MNAEIKCNFKCPLTEKLFNISNYRVKFVGGGMIYTDLSGNEIVNPDNGEKLVFVEEKGEFNVNIGLFNSLTPREKQAVLRQRSKEHSNKNKEYFHAVNRGEIKK